MPRRCHITFKHRLLGSAIGAAGTVLLSMWPAPLVLASNPFGSAPALSDEDLSSQRGGFISADGVRIAIGYTMETHIDGALVMRSYVTLGQSNGVIDPSAGYSGTVSIGPANTAAQSISTSAAAPAYLVPQASSTPGSQVFTINRPGTSLAIAAPTPTAPAGAEATSQVVTYPVSTTMLEVGEAYYDGMVSGSGYSGTYSAPGVEIMHQINGGIPSAIISNTSSNRTIDHNTVVNLDLSDVSLPPSGTLGAVNGSVMDGLGVFRRVP